MTVLAGQVAVPLWRGFWRIYVIDSRARLRWRYRA